MTTRTMLDNAGAMKPRDRIDGAAFGPEALKAIGQAFDQAWQEIAGNFGDDPQGIETACTKLANAVLSIADEDSRDVDVLKRAALQRMALDYRRRSFAPSDGTLPMANVSREKI